MVVAITGASGVLSALFVNDTVCLMFTPIVLEVAALRGLTPLPLLLIDVPTNSVATMGLSISRSSTRNSLTQLLWMSPVSTTGLDVRRRAMNSSRRVRPASYPDH